MYTVYPDNCFVTYPTTIDDDYSIGSVTSPTAPSAVFLSGFLFCRLRDLSQAMKVQQNWDSSDKPNLKKRIQLHSMDWQETIDVPSK